LMSVVERTLVHLLREDALDALFCLPP
jgi:hypothetical protein